MRPPPRILFQVLSALVLALLAPVWAVLLVASTLPTFGFAHFTGRIHLRRRPPGACPACGYDLRATPTRCPECGAVPTGAS